jgi:hypothetical protein
LRRHAPAIIVRWNGNESPGPPPAGSPPVAMPAQRPPE